MADYSGSLVKLKITAFTDPGFNDQWGQPLSVQVNPSRYARQIKVCFTGDDAQGGGGKAQIFNKLERETLELDLVFDGTGAVDGEAVSVAGRLKQLRELAVRIQGDTHEPNYLVLSWGGLLFKGRMQSLGIDYTLFNPDGSPLRAKVKAKFVGFHENVDARAETAYQSPDLTRLVVVRPGETLPLLCHRVYGDSRYYAQVAQANGLAGFRSIPAGTRLLFPPLARSGA